MRKLIAALLLCTSPAFALSLNNGQTSLPLSQLLDGRPAVIHFWATWCAPCLEELPELNEVIASDQLPVIVVSVDDDEWSVVDSFLDEHAPDIPPYQVVSPEEWFKSFEMKGFPSTYIVDGQGDVLYAHTGALNWADSTIVNELKATLQAAP